MVRLGHGGVNRHDHYAFQNKHSSRDFEGHGAVAHRHALPTRQDSQRELPRKNLQAVFGEPLAVQNIV
jgi:hypothetical protein